MVGCVLKMISLINDQLTEMMIVFALRDTIENICHAVAHQSHSGITA
jgi:hypothetical protein